MTRKLMFPLVRGLALLLLSLGYRVRIRGGELVPRTGPVVLVANHVSYIDALFVAASVRRPIRFVMSAKIYGLPLVRRFFALMGAIPIASRREDAEATRLAFDSVADALERGEAVCIFPEGHLTADGAIDRFRGGVEQIVARTPAPVVPIALRGLWGSVFSRRHGRALSRLPEPGRRCAEIIIGAPVPAHAVDADRLRAQVLALHAAQA